MHRNTHTSVYILTHKHILCLGNRLHMVGSGRGPEDFLFFFLNDGAARHALPQPGHSLALTAPNTPGSLSNETGSLLTVMSWMHPTKDDVTGSAICVIVTAPQREMVVNWWCDYVHVFLELWSFVHWFMWLFGEFLITSFGFTFMW